MERQDTIKDGEVSRDELLSRLRRGEAQLRGLGLTALRMYGSRARGDNRADSDVDLLIEYDKSRKFSLVDLVRAEHFLEKLVGLPVQLTTESSVPSTDRRRIEKDVVPVF